MKPLFYGHEKASGLYQIRNTINGWVYLGTASLFRNRFSDHLRRLRVGTHYNGPLQADFNSHGEDSFTFEVIALIRDPKVRLQIEEDAIRLSFGPGCYNLSAVNPPYVLGIKRSPETRAKMSASFKGRVVAPEAREKIRTALTGRKATEETKQKMSAQHSGVPIPNARGKKRSPETKTRMSESALSFWGGRTPEEVSLRTQAMQNARRGSTNSEGHRARISAGKLGKSSGPQSPEHLTKRVASRKATIEAKKALSTVSPT